jgi:hypothetical protein
MTAVKEGNPFYAGGMSIRNCGQVNPAFLQCLLWLLIVLSGGLGGCSTLKDQALSTEGAAVTVPGAEAASASTGAVPSNQPDQTDTASRKMMWIWLSPSHRNMLHQSSAEYVVEEVRL